MSELVLLTVLIGISVSIRRQNRRVRGFRDTAVNRLEGASHRAQSLFLESLHPDQLRQWDQQRMLTITGSDGRRYTLCYATSTYNVLDHKTGNGLCAGPLGFLPGYDKLLAQKLLIETNAKEFRRIAHAGEWPLVALVGLRRETPPDPGEIV